MLYDIFAVSITVVGVFSSVFLMKRAFVNRNNKVVFANLSVLSLCDLWVAGVYLLTLFGSIETPHLTIGVYIRPVMILLILIPSLLVKGGKL